MPLRDVRPSAQWVEDGSAALPPPLAPRAFISGGGSFAPLEASGEITLAAVASITGGASFAALEASGTLNVGTGLAGAVSFGAIVAAGTIEVTDADVEDAVIVEGEDAIIIAPVFSDP